MLVINKKMLFEELFITNLTTGMLVALLCNLYGGD